MECSCIKSADIRLRGQEVVKVLGEQKCYSEGPQQTRADRNLEKLK